VTGEVKAAVKAEVKAEVKVKVEALSIYTDLLAAAALYFVVV
jgi:hypothetical protein